MELEAITRPRFSPQEGLAIAAGHFGVAAQRALPLPSDRDQNFLLEENSGRRYVLKLAHAGEELEVLDLQNRILEHLALAGFPQSKLLRTTDGEEVVPVEGAEGKLFFTRLLTWLPGEILAAANPRTPELFRSLGSFLGGMDRALEDFRHPAQDRELKWDLKRASRAVRAHLEYVEEGARRELLEEMAGRFMEALGPIVPELRMSVIHGDANDHNVLVNPLDPEAPDFPQRRVVGVVDFGDALRSYTCGEAAIAGAYLMLGREDPLPAAAHLVAGYHRALPLREEEIAALFPLMGLRLCSSVAIAAHQKLREPDNAYLTVSEAPAWALLERLERESLELPHFLFREACGLEPVPGSGAVVGWLKENGFKAAPVVGKEAPGGESRLLDVRTTPLHVLDLSVGSGELGIPPEPDDARGWTELLFSQIRKAGAELGIGRYDELRRWYASELFRAPGDEAPEWRTVHLGVDLFVEEGSPVHAPLDAVVHSLADNAAPLDYGPTVILEHQVEGPEGALVFHTLYGHLAPEALSELIPGQILGRGERFASVGSFPRNGNWPPHLHFQLITHLLGRRGEFPGVARPSQRALWKALSPDPHLLLGEPEGAHFGATLTPREGRSQEELLELRRRHLGPSLSLAYRRPLKLVRGWRQLLYDEEGQPYLDCVNNVPHVGHGHPRVVEAGQRQMAVLNTNTRYLHDLRAEYVERLLATLPPPLSVVYFVCTGSEANELALRMARAHTRKKDVITVEGGYHGHTSSLVDISPYKFDGPGGEGPRRWVHKVPVPDPYRGLFRDPPGPGEDPPGIRYADQVRQVVARLRAEGRAPSAFFCEPLMGCAGQIVLPDGYLAAAYAHVRGAGGVCVADEVQVGFGRVGTHFWAFQTQGVVPDILTLGKPMGNGHPMGAVVTTPEIAASFATGMEYFNTFGGNPVSCAIGLAVLDVLQEEGLQENARVVGEHLLAGLEGLMAKHPRIGDVRGLGLYLGVELVEDRESRAPATLRAARVVERLRDHHLLLSTDGPAENVLKIKPPMVFTRDDADRLVAVLDKVLAEDGIR